MMFTGPESELPPPSSRLVKSRLLDALDLTSGPLAPGNDLSWIVEKTGNIFLGYALGSRSFRVEGRGFSRTERESDALALNGLVMVLHCLKRSEFAFFREMVQEQFATACFDQARVIAPAAAACADHIFRTGGEAIDWRSITTADQLVALPIDPNTKIRRIVEVIPSLVLHLGAQLEAEGHEPYDRNYFSQFNPEDREPHSV